MVQLFVCAALAYAAALVPLVAPVASAELRLRLARGSLAVAAGFHFLVIGSQCMVGHHPLISIALSMSVAGWLAVVGYFVVSRGQRAMRPVAVVVAVLALAALTGSVVWHPESVRGAYDAPWMLRVHVALAMAGVGGFALATGVAGLYLSMQRRLRNHELPATSRGTSLMGLDRLHYWVVAVVTPIFTLALATGSVVAVQLGGAQMLADRAVELAASGVAFVASVAVLASRAIWGLRGRRAAWLTLLAALAIIVVVMAYGVRL